MPGFIFISLLILANCCFAQETTHRFFNDLKTTENPGYWMNISTRTQDQKDTINFFSLTNGKSPYGIGFESELPSALKKKNIYLYIKARLKISDTTQNIQLVSNLFCGDSTIIWKGVNVAAKFGKMNEWIDVHDSLFIPLSLPADAKIKVYVWNQDGKSEAGIDDLDITLSVLKVPSYLIH